MSWAFQPLLGAAQQLAARQIRMLADVGSFSETGQVANKVQTYAAIATVGSYTSTGQDVLFTIGTAARHILMTADVGSFSETGQVVTLARSYSLPITVATFAENGQTVVLSYKRVFASAVGTFTETGQVANSRRTYNFITEVGSFSKTGQIALFRRTYSVPSNVGTFTLNGQTVVLRHSSVVTSNAGSFALSGLTTTVLSHSHTLTADASTYSLNGQSSGFINNKAIGTNAGSFALSGQSVGLLRAYNNTANVGSLALSGLTTTTLVTGHTLTASNGSFSLNGQDVRGLDTYRLTAEADVVATRTVSQTNYNNSIPFENNTAIGQVVDITGRLKTTSFRLKNNSGATGTVVGKIYPVGSTTPVATSTNSYNIIDVVDNINGADYTFNYSDQNLYGTYNSVAEVTSYNNTTVPGSTFTGFTQQSTNDTISFINSNIKPANLTSVMASNSSIIVKAGSGNIVWTSTDGLNWIARDIPQASTSVTALVWAQELGLFVGGCSNGQFIVSQNGINWATANNWVGNTSINKIIWTGSKLLAVLSSVGYVGISTDGLNWTGNEIRGNTYSSSLSLHVSVGIGGTILTSSDGTTWTPRTSNVVTTLNSVVWNGSQFVAVGLSGAITTSTNGTTWVARSSGTTNSLLNVIWTGSKFVAVGSSNTVITSLDGVTWTLVTATNILPGNCIAWSGTTYVLGSAGGAARYSSDLVTWFSPPLGTGTGAAYSSVTWSGTQFVMVGLAGVIITSPDGVTWTTRTSNTTSDLYGVTWSGTQFVAVGLNENILTSPDGVTWTVRRNITSSVILYSVIWDGSKFVTIGNSSKKLTSTDGITWNAISVGLISTNLNDVVWDGTRFIIGYVTTLASSTDGINWSTLATLPGTFFRIAYSGTNYVYFTSGNTIYSSPDAVTWTMSTSMISTSYAIIWDGSKYIIGGTFGYIADSATGLIGSWTVRQANTFRTISSIHKTSVSGAPSYIADGGVLLHSSDGVTWTNKERLYTQRIATNGSTYIGVGATDIAKSTDGVNWTSIASAIPGFQSTRLTGMNDIAYGNGTWVIVNTSGNGTHSFIYYSNDDGVSFTAANVWQGTGIAPTCVTYNNDLKKFSMNAGGAAPGGIYHSYDGIAWTGDPLLETHYGITYGNGLYVSCGDNSAISTSTDGITWTKRYGVARSSSGGNYYSITYSGTRFFTGGATATQPSLYSDDGITWNRTYLWNTSEAVTYGNSKFVSVGSTGSSTAICESSDGINWYSQPIIYGMAYSSSLGLYVRVGALASVMTSTDGVSWTYRNSSFTNTSSNAQFINVIWSSSLGLFVAAGSNSAGASLVVTSPDGITWTTRSSGGGTGFTGLAYDGTKFIAVASGYGSGTIYTSTDGITWTTGTSIGTQVQRIDYVGSLWIAHGVAGNIRTSPDGVTWTARTSGTVNGLFGATWTGTQYVICGNAGTILTSPDGITWTSRTSGTTNGLVTIITAPDGTILAAGVGATVIKSTDGITWSAVGVGVYLGPSSQQLWKVYNDGTKVFLMGVSTFLYSTDSSATWNPLTNLYSSTLYGVAWSSTLGLYAAGGNSGLIYTSPDAINWTPRTTPTTQAINDLLFANGLFVAAATAGVILTSPDGITWTSRTSNAAGQLNHILWTGSKFIACGGTLYVTTSPDGITWTLLTASSGVLYHPMTMWAMATNGSRIVLTGTRGLIRYSDNNAVNWSAGAIYGLVESQNRIIYAGGKYVIACDNNSISTSTDGLSWRLTKAPTSTIGITDVTYAKELGLYVATSGAANLVYTSPDADTWTTRTLPSAVNTMNKIVWTGSRFIVNNGLYDCAYSTNGITWTGLYGTTSTTNYKVAYSGSTYVVVGGQNGVVGTIITSTDGTTWVPRVSGTTQLINDVIWSGTQFVAVGNTGYISTSPDGITWTIRTSGTGGNLNTITYNGTTFVARNASASTIVTSTDGITWSASTVSTGSWANAIIWVAALNLYITVSNSGVINTGTSALVWTSRTSGTTQNLYSVVWNGTKLIAVGGNGVMITSTDGINWSPIYTDPYISRFDSIVWNTTRSEFIVCGYKSNTSSGYTYTSPDGINWTFRARTFSMKSIIWDGSRYISVGESGTINISSNGINWVNAGPTSTNYPSAYHNGKLFYNTTSVGSGLNMLTLDQ